MNKGYKQLCDRYNEKIVNDLDIKENKLTGFLDCRKRINFSVNVSDWAPCSQWSFDYNGDNLFVLDAEDMEYLYKKYSKKVQDELDKNIAELKDEYKSALGSATIKQALTQ